MTDLSALFPSSYEASRTRFLSSRERVQRRWPQARLGQHRLAGDEDLTLDWLQADAVERQERLVLITTGEHGIETYVGAAMLQLFIDDYLDRLDPRSTGLLFVHAINPWGMKHKRRVNRNNIDLNRTFFWSATGAPPFDPAYNPDYPRLEALLNPAAALPPLWQAEPAFLFRLAAGMAQVGAGRLMTASTIGQYVQPRGIYYGGAEVQEETLAMMELYRQSFRQYAQVVHLDMHTGYGPRYQMSVVTSEHEPRTSATLRELFAYPLVVKANAAEFYSIRGDMIDYVYLLQRDAFPERRLFSTTLEFGTLGDTLFNHYRDLRTMVFENQVHWHGAASAALQRQVAADFEAMFFPHAPRWQAKAVADARQAYEGILRTEGYWAR